MAAEGATLNVTNASALLDLELDRLDRYDNARSSEGRDRHGNRSFITSSTGIKSLDHDGVGDILRMGTVVGIGGGESSFEEDAHNLLASILATNLLESGSNPGTSTTSVSNSDVQVILTAKPNVFIISPPNTSMISSIFDTLRNTTAASTPVRGPRPQSKATPSSIHTEDSLLSLLDNISLLQYLSLPGLIESLSEVSILVDSATASTSPSSLSSSSSATKSIVLIQGLMQTISSLLSSRSRTSMAITQTAALMTRIMRSLRSLSLEKNVLVLLEVDMYTVPSVTTSTSTSTSSSAVESGVLRSAFTDDQSRFFRLGVDDGDDNQKEKHNEIGEQGGSTRADLRSKTNRYHNNGKMGDELLGKIVEDGLDGIVVVFDGFKKGDDVVSSNKISGTGTGRPTNVVPKKRVVVELLKDGYGDGKGVWSLWNS